MSSSRKHVDRKHDHGIHVTVPDDKADHEDSRSETETDQEILQKFNLRKGMYHWHSMGSMSNENLMEGYERPHEHANLRECSPHGETMWKLMPTYLPTDVQFIQKQIVNHVEYTLARNRYNFDAFTAYQATALSVRDRLIESWNDTQAYFHEKDPRMVYYLSLEFLMGRSLQNAVQNLELEEEYSAALKGIGYHLEGCYEEEVDAALGNGGLGRLAACFMDSMATSNLPAWGYGIRYKYGMFRQKIDAQGNQVERPDYWLTLGNPWEIERPDVYYPIQYFGQTRVHEDVVDSSESESDRDPTTTTGSGTHRRKHWEGGEIVFAVAYDTPIPGHNTSNTLNIRLWSAKPAFEFDFASFNQGNYFKAVQQKERTENLTAVLYPNDDTYSGKELRLKQQYFFVCATLKDIVRRFKETDSYISSGIQSLPEKVAIQLNDTHPSLGVAELMRILVDEEGIEWNEAWDLVTRTFHYTNHTVLPEALEKWSVELFSRLLPRHLEIIFDINFELMQAVEKKWPGDVQKMRNISIIEEGPMKMVRMANLAIAGSAHVNGVAEIHSKILQERIFPDHVEFFGPKKFLNVTNGVTPRRWLAQANPSLSTLISNTLGGDEWIHDSTQLLKLVDLSEDEVFQGKWFQAHMLMKKRLVRYIRRMTGIEVSETAMFDVHIKRIHEYKRQLMNILGVIYRYYFLKKIDPQTRSKVVKKVVIFAGKAAPGYDMAKRIIRLINSVARIVNSDPDIGDILKVVFLPNYGVSAAEVIIPGTDISQHISTAGMEASGTSNMKFVMNGALIIGTMDGANVEISEQIGKDNLFIFGALAHEVNGIREALRNGGMLLDSKLVHVFSLIERGTFGPPEFFAPVINSVRHGHDYYLVTADFESYIRSLQEVDRCFCNKREWVRRSILATAGGGHFSSDISINKYAEKIWEAEPCARPTPQFKAKPAPCPGEEKAPTP